jgi:hypothetical protein
MMGQAVLRVFFGGDTYKMQLVKTGGDDIHLPMTVLPVALDKIIPFIGKPADDTHFYLFFMDRLLLHGYWVLLNSNSRKLRAFFTGIKPGIRLAHYDFLGTRFPNNDPLVYKLWRMVLRSVESRLLVSFSFG